jgi:hypothetical protein
MKKNIQFKFEIGQRIFILGRTGISVITGRGQMEFASGGKMNWYSLEGAHQGLHPETSLITTAEANRIQ